MRNREDLCNAVLVKSTMKIPPTHSGTLPIKIKGHDLQDQVAHFFSNHHTMKELDTHILILDGIYNIKGKSMLYMMVANYTVSTSPLTKDNA